MADTDTDTYNKPPTKSNPKNLFSHFIFKSAIVTLLFLVLLPFFSSQVPDFINQSFNTRSWELLQLVLVGIAVSYGLFSQKTEESSKEQSSGFDNAAHSYVSKFLEVSSVFDVETENPTGSDHDNKIESWNSQYFREEPMVVVAQDQESSVLDQEQRSLNKPILLPIRSLNSRIPNSHIPLRSSSLRISDENVVLRSPIPWRSRSGRMEMKEEIGIDPNPPLIDESQIGRFKPSTEESQRQKICYKAAPPPPPPPQPPTRSYSDKGLKNEILTHKKPNTESGSKVRSFVPVSEKRVEPIFLEDSSSDDEKEEEVEERHSNGEEEENGLNDDVGPDVNKQADEFIAKFREQIRLQRIDSIKRSTKRNSNK
ncbi:uncharacterized protein LOC124942837 [Impatiens glandulifera]|uniref:uncharacterized protein LOC124942837 n=1 Tax=Impatiens glandulifera TaxID=253017 RepID=UPI001FB08051|nr:uncharacterized protein LOC124942837 [Impatiens glandulifera]